MACFQTFVAPSSTSCHFPGLPDSAKVDFLELAEPRSAVTTLPSVVKWTESNFPGYVKILGSVVDDREKPLKERKVIGLIYEVRVCLEVYSGRCLYFFGDVRCTIAFQSSGFRIPVCQQLLKLLF